VWLPAFLNAATLEALGRLVRVDHVLTGNNLAQCGGHLAPLEREQARPLLVNLRDQLRQRLRGVLFSAYGVGSQHRDSLDSTHAPDLDQQFQSLNPGLRPRPPVGSSLAECLAGLLDQALTFQYPDHPHFSMEVRRAGLRRVLEMVRGAVQDEGRVEVPRSHREEMKHIAVPLELGRMGETHFQLGSEWRGHFLRLLEQSDDSQLTVGQLRRWTESPRPRGLPPEAQRGSGQAPRRAGAAHP